MVARTSHKQKSCAQSHHQPDKRFPASLLELLHSPNNIFPGIAQAYRSGNLVDSLAELRSEENEEKNQIYLFLVFTPDMILLNFDTFQHT